ncbi:MAG: ABC transporter ATP-binding protein/permease [Bacteroidia bacterium]|nr:ABC transporter ATP-binding protein/permease [Bacteroidia bacterium]
MSIPNKNKIDFLLLGRVLKTAKPYKGLFIWTLILAVVLAPVATIRPYLVQTMVDDYIFKNDLGGLYWMGVLFIGVLILSGILRYLFIYSSSLLGQNVIKDLRVRVFSHITSLRLTFFDNTPIGTSTTRTINDIETINSVFTQGVMTIIADLFTLFFVFALMMYSSWQLTLVCLTTIPFMIGASYVFKESVKKSYQKVRKQISKMNAFLQERISGMRIIQIFNAEEQELKKFGEINRAYTQANLNAIFAYAVFYPVVEIISATSLGLMVWWGARGVISSEISLGVLVAFPIYLSMLFRPIRMLADKFNTLQMGLVAAERVFTLLDTEDKIKDTGTIKAKDLDGHIRFDDVSFSYVLGQKVLKNVSFELKKGETMAIVGSTGSGKSTIINILNRFYPLTEGKITIDDVEIRDYELESLRSRIALVLQDVFLFSGSVIQNITLMDEEITREEVIDAAKTIGAHEFIMRLPGGYDFEVMERGATLSMGQRQLISFVRALVVDPDILILDEATSSIDPETESVIQHAIETLIEKRTSIIIAHRLSTIKHANQIMVLSQGEIMERGTHKELLRNQDGHYRQLYEMQFASTQKAAG